MDVNNLPPDGGMLYTETDMSRLFPEPLNGITALFFLGIAIYFSWKIRGNLGAHRFLVFALFLLYIGGIGGTIYHGLRQWWIFIIMDWLPIMLLCLSAGMYFIARLTRWYFAVLLLGAYIVFQYFWRGQMQPEDMQFFINVNYAIMASLVLFPVLAFLISTRFRHGKWVGMALLGFVLALTFRAADRLEWLTVGTHFLWHTFGAVAAFCMLQYLWLLNASKEQPA